MSLQFAPKLTNEMLVVITVLARLRISISTDVIGCLQMGSLDLVSMENNNLSARSMSLDNNCLFWYLCKNPGLSHLNICTSRVFSHSHLGTNPAPKLLLDAQAPLCLSRPGQFSCFWVPVLFRPNMHFVPKFYNLVPVIFNFN